jgi:hypothetical protein
MGGGTTTGAGATTTGAGTGIPKLIPKRTPAFAAVIPKVARPRIAIVFFIMSKGLDVPVGQNFLTTGLPFCKLWYRLSRAVAPVPIRAARVTPPTPLIDEQGFSATCIPMQFCLS